MRGPGARAALGFTLVELLVGVAVAGFALAATANIARWGMQASNRGVQSTELSDRAKLIGEQLRTDLELAGLGSPGVIAVDAGLGLGPINTMGGRIGVPAVRGADNVVGQSFTGLSPIMDGTDVLQVVVPSPGDVGRVSARAVNPGTILTFDPLDPVLGPNPLNPANCPTSLVYIVEGGAPNGVGRVQLARATAFAPAQITLSSQLQFTVEVGAQVMCARVSTYWVDEDGNLMRTDVGGPPPYVNVAVAGSGMRSSNATVNDLLTPGVVDFQVAYALSAAASDPAVAADNRWVFQGDGSTVAHNDTTDWFEVRQVRFNLVLRNLRDPNRSSTMDTMISQGTFMNGAIDREVEVSRSVHIVDTTASLSNLRYFDRLVPEGTDPEPY